MYGNPVWLTGCNWFGYNVGSQVFLTAYGHGICTKCLQKLQTMGLIFFVFLCLLSCCFNGKTTNPIRRRQKINEWTNPELTVEGVVGGKVKYSFDVWNQAVKWCRELGIKIMIDIHSAETASAQVIRSAYGILTNIPLKTGMKL